MRSISRRSWIAAVGLLLSQMGNEARAQVVTADRLELAPTDPSFDGFVLPGGPVAPAHLGCRSLVGTVD